MFSWIKRLFKKKEGVQVGFPLKRTKKNVGLDDMREELLFLWDSMVFRQERSKDLQKLVDKFIANKQRYVSVEQQTTVPAALIFAIHHKEGSADMKRGLHNGGPWDRVTTKVPKGLGPFESWEASAVDALNRKKHLYGAWSVERCLHFALAFNGMGYQFRGVNSPYVWCGTNHYERGGYPRDGYYDPMHIIRNLGVAPILKELEKLGHISFAEELIPLAMAEEPEIPRWKRFLMGLS